MAIHCACNVGSIPQTWSAVGAFSAVSELELTFVNITGTLPASWGSTSLQNASILWLETVPFTGTLPAEWGNVTAFRNLTDLYINHSSITGTITCCGRNF